MSTTLMAATALSGATVLLLVVLGWIWVRNYQRFRTPLVLGLVGFAVVLLIENLVALYFYVSTQSLYAMDPTVHTTVAIMRALEFVAVALLAYVTWQ
ncbi:MAG: hypothetical protein ABEH64_01110 [Salinirussus sp.]